MIRALDTGSPLIDATSFVHPAAEVIGDVELGAQASVWPMAVVRADAEAVRVGRRTNLQDGVVVHADPGFPCLIGSDVTVGHRACLHGCTVEDASLIGIGATVLNGARIGAGSIVGAGAVVPEGAVIPPGSLVLGIPGRVRRPTTDTEREGLVAQAGRYVEMAARHRDASVVD
jgi:carbonic anhydrase/acetyltransferase-like protein (isoleucine patch superfamily)